ncbi:hypothetical protein EVA_21468, partial [gut metagenome]
ANACMGKKPDISKPVQVPDSLEEQ